ncbi:MAG: hypothetical protein R8G34_01340 [Paracoccaceae bacterium]|nr:hypothetical protein [Paracoccaceae bacterium]
MDYFPSNLNRTGAGVMHWTAGASSFGFVVRKFNAAFIFGVDHDHGSMGIGTSKTSRNSRSEKASPA